MERTPMNGHEITLTLPFELSPQEAAEIVRALQVVGRVGPVVGLGAPLHGLMTLGQKFVDRCAIAGYVVGVDSDGNAVAVRNPNAASALAAP